MELVLSSGATLSDIIYGTQYTVGAGMGDY